MPFKEIPAMLKMGEINKIRKSFLVERKISFGRQLKHPLSCIKKFPFKPGNVFMKSAVVPAEHFTQAY